MQRRYGLLMAITVLLGGCGPELSKGDLGQVVFELPKVAGSDKPYPMPQLGRPQDSGTQGIKGERSGPRDARGGQGETRKGGD
jgi:hypothetical protein